MKYTVKIDQDLAELVPVYLQSRRDEVPVIAGLLEKEDFAGLKAIAHRLHGSGGGFGLDFLTELGKRMEASAAVSDKAALAAQTAELKDFLENLEIEYVPAD
ncbi:MAG: Hpt domain-containing protein [Elusimicrobiales bacterium]|nr:Hpt domain-containing protein [Elusimicrobiales bacterium]